MAKYVMKFGGTSLKDAPAIERAAGIVENFYNTRNPEQLVVVVSAFGKIGEAYEQDKMTNLLERIYRRENVSQNMTEIERRVNQIYGDLGYSSEGLCDTPLIPDVFMSRLSKIRPSRSNRTYAEIVSMGEEMAAIAFGGALRTEDRSNVLGFDEFGMRTRGRQYRNAQVIADAGAGIRRALECQGRVVVVPGFIGYNSQGEVTTLGRDGSNYTAAVIGGAIGAEGVYIFSDEPGIRRAPPKHVPDAGILEELTYSEAIEFAELGAKIIHAPAIVQARDSNTVMHFVDENYNGTRITNSIDRQHHGARMIAASGGHSIITIRYDEDKPGMLSEVAGLFGEADVNIESIADERHSLSIAYVPSDENRIRKLMQRLDRKYEYAIEDNFSRISVIGEGMRGQRGLLGRVASCFARGNISVDMISQSLNQLNITTFIPQEFESQAVKSLYEKLFIN